MRPWFRLHCLRASPLQDPKASKATPRFPGYATSEAQLTAFGEVSVELLPLFRRKTRLVASPWWVEEVWNSMVGSYG